MRTLPSGTCGPDGPGTGGAHRAAPGRRRRRLRLPGDDLDRVEERHLGPELGADALDLVVAVGLAEALELGGARLALGDPAGGERAVLDVAEDLAHGVPDPVVDDPRPDT
jgi:hypothetical protein